MTDAAQPEINPATDLDLPVDERGVASAINGLVVVSATMVAAAQSHRISYVVIASLITMLVFWAAESYAHGLARRLVKRTELSHAESWAILKQGWPTVGVSILPLGALLLADAFGASLSDAMNVALALVVVLLTLTGWATSRACGVTGGRLIRSTLISTLLGLVLVGLKNLVH